MQATITKRPQPAIVWTGHVGGVTSASVSADGRFLATGGYDSRFRVWEVPAGMLRHDLEGNRRGHVAFWPGRERLLTGGLYGETKLWDTATWQPCEAVEAFDGLWWMTFSPNGSVLASVHADSSVRFWDTGDWEMKRQADVGAQCYSAGFSPDGRALVFVLSNTTVSVWDSATFRELIAFEAHSPRVHCVAFSPDGRMLVSGGADCKALVWDTATWQVQQVFEHDAPVLCATFSPDSEYLITGCLDGSLRLWHLEESRKVSKSITEIQALFAEQAFTDSSEFQREDWER